MFLLKKLVSACLLPMPLFLAAIATGLILLWFTKRQRAGRIAVTAGFLPLLILSYASVSELFLVPLENDFQPLLVQSSTGGGGGAYQARARQARWIVVLGGGHVADAALPPNTQIQPPTLSRLVEALRLKRHLPDARIVLSGGYGLPGPSHADVMAAAAHSLGARSEDLIIERRTYDTHDEARFIREIVGRDPFILVSSASHLPRAVALFRKQGLDALPSPTDFTTTDAPGVSLGSFFPGSAGIGNVERAAHEYLGLIWSRLRGQL